MKKHSDDIDQLSQDIMEKYLGGTLSDRQMHQVEKLLLESEFESDAMEGMETISSADFRSDVEELNARLQQRTKPSGTFHWWQLAAVLAILISAGILFIILPGKDEPHIAMNHVDSPNDKEATGNSDTPAKKSIVIDSNHIASFDEENATSNSRQAEVRKKLFNSSPTKKTASSEKDEKDDETVQIDENSDVTLSSKTNDEIYSNYEDQEDKESESSPKARSISPNAIAKKDVLTESPEKPETVTPISTDDARKQDFQAHMEGRAAGVELTPENMAVASSSGARLINGQVLSENGQPLPGANITIKGSSLGTVANQEGHFQLDVPANEKPTLIVSMVGMVTEEISNPPSDTVSIVMDDDVQSLSEVVVVGDESKSEQESVYIAATPAMGITSYEDYLESNVQYPKGETKQGHVILTFQVRPDGSLTDFDIKKSLGEKFDAEAIRLIKDGPPWEPAINQGQAVSDKVRIKVRFKLSE